MSAFEIFFNTDILLRSFPILLRGLVYTIGLGVVAIVFGTLGGAGVCLLRLYGWKPLRYAAIVYTDLMRAMPVLVVLILIYYALPFVGILLSIATGPLLYPHLWEHHYGKFAALWAALEGSMLPIGAVSSPKGAMLALVVELLVTAVIGANFGFEASSFFVDEGNRPGIGQAFIVIDPGALAGSTDGAGYLDRLEVLVSEMLGDEGVRLPGARREDLRRKAEADGLNVPDAMLASLNALAGR